MISAYPDPQDDISVAVHIRAEIFDASFSAFEADWSAPPVHAKTSGQNFAFSTCYSLFIFFFIRFMVLVGHRVFCQRVENFQIKIGFVKPIPFLVIFDLFNRFKLLVGFGTAFKSNFCQRVKNVYNKKCFVEPGVGKTVDLDI